MCIILPYPDPLIRVSSDKITRHKFPNHRLVIMFFYCLTPASLSSLIHSMLLEYSMMKTQNMHFVALIYTCDYTGMDN